MSTRSSVYYEDDGVHIYHDFIDPDVPLYLKFANGAFCVEIPLSQRLADVIIAGLKALPAAPDAKASGGGRSES